MEIDILGRRFASPSDRRPGTPPCKAEGPESSFRIIGHSVQRFKTGDLCPVGSFLRHSRFKEEAGASDIRALVLQVDPIQWREAFLLIPLLVGIDVPDSAGTYARVSVGKGASYLLHGR